MNDYTKAELKLANELTNWDQDTDCTNIDVEGSGLNPSSAAYAGPTARELRKLQEEGAIAGGQRDGLKDVAVEQGKTIVRLGQRCDDLLKRLEKLEAVPDVSESSYVSMDDVVKLVAEIKR